MILYYLVNVTEQETGSTFGHVSLRTNFTLFGLHPYYNYQITTTAVTVGQGPSTSPVVITTDQDGETKDKVHYLDIYRKYECINLTFISNSSQWSSCQSECYCYVT